jgi:hypothetical protein
MFPSAFYSSLFCFKTKPQISDLLVWEVPYSLRHVVSKEGKELYRYGLNTPKKEDEIYGDGNSYSAEYWQYDARLGKSRNVGQVTNPGEVVIPVSGLASQYIFLVL